MIQHKTALILLIILLNTSSTFACLSATQNRMFPIGMTGKGLLVVETHLQRTEYVNVDIRTEKMEPAWRGVAYFKLYDNNFNSLRIELLDTIKLFEQLYYDSIIGGLYNKGVELAKKYSDFIPAKPVSITFCDYQVRCSKASLSFDTIANITFVKLTNGKKYKVNQLHDTTSIASNVVFHFNGFGERDFTTSDLKGRLFISSVRQFKLGERKLTIVHLGTGQIFELPEGGTYPPGKDEYKAKFAFNDINKSVFDEPVLHHGDGFDFAIWE